MSQRRVIAELFAERRDDLVKYAGAVSGDDAGAEDLVQEAWLRCDRAARDGRIERPAHLLWRILRNVSIDRGRRIAHEKRMIVGGESEQRLAVHADEQPCVEAMLIAREELARIQAVLDTLDPRTRSAFEMHRFEGARLRQIAARLGVSVTVAHGLVAKALARVRQAVRQDA
ncbi:sigma-70 family RNA polymerase sigma factor [Sphingomonas flavalba]|uniref:sigma-70 family RNA polymerase sigma factor n=1 Tax=Sphingomonas flavalba TaxID=2559804 RepID=UPI0039DF6779